MALWCLGELKREKSFTMILVPGNHDRVYPMCGMDSVVTWTYEVWGSLRCDLVGSAGADWSVACVVDSYSAGCGGFAVVDPHQSDKLARWAARAGV